MAERPSPFRLLSTVLYLLIWPVTMLFLSGDWGWIEGWIFGGWFVSVSAAAIAWLYLKDPALLAERYRRPGTGAQSPPDRVIVALLVIGFMGWVVLMPLDGRRLHWTPALPPAVRIVGGALLALAWFFLFRSFTDNTYLSPLVRVQTERKQRVVSTGVYGFVRHPMYLGASLMFVGGSLLTGAATALALAIALVALLAVRITVEEKLLARELEGYDEYRRRVRYRLLPLVW